MRRKKDEKRLLVSGLNGHRPTKKCSRCHLEKENNGNLVLCNFCVSVINKLRE